MLVGREQQLERVTRLLESVRSGTSAVLVVTGGPGIGKTALLKAAAEAAHGCSVVFVRAAPRDATLGFAGLVPLVRGLSDALQDLPSAQSTMLRRACGLDAPDGSPDRLSLSVAVLQLVAAAAERRPVVLTVDDVQWLDSESRDALFFTARRLAHDRVAMLFACRTGGRQMEQPVDVANAAVMELAGLDRREIAALIHATTGVHAVASVIDELAARTAGCPLMVIELAQRLDEPTLRGRWPLPSDGFQSGTGTTYEATVDALQARESDALALFALAEGDDAVAVLRAAAALGVDRDTIARLEELGLVSFAGGRITLAHALLAGVVSRRLSEQSRRRIHGAVANALAARGSTAECAVRAAWHRAGSVSFPDEAAAAALETVATDRGVMGSWSASALAFERAAGLTPDPKTRAERLQSAADAAWIAGLDDWSIVLLTRARADASDAMAQAKIDHARGTRQVMTGRSRTAWHLLVPAADAATGYDREYGGVILADAALAALLTGRLDDARNALERWHASGSNASQLAADVADGLVLWHQGDVGAGLRALKGISGSQDLLDRLLPVVEYVVPVAIGLTWAGEHDVAVSLSHSVVGWLRSGGGHGILPAALYAAAYANAWQGRLNEAATLAGEAKLLADDRTNSLWRFLAAGCLSLIDALRGDPEACRNHAAEAQHASSRTEVWLPRDVDDALGLIALMTGDTAEAVARLTTAATPEPGGQPCVVRPTTPDLVEACRRAGRPLPAAIRLQIDGPSRPPVESALLWRSRAVAAQTNDHKPFAATLACFARCASPWQEARARLAFGDSLRRAGHRTKAREQLLEAARLFQTTGSHGWVEQAQIRLAACGGAGPRRQSGSPESLTPQERQIVSLVVKGATNREIGSSLFLSPKTVEMHLTHIYRKFNLRSRAELVAYLATRNLS